MSLSEDEVQAFADDLLEQLTQKDLVSFTNMDESSIEVMQQVIDLQLNRSLCEQNEFQKIMEALW